MGSSSPPYDHHHHHDLSTSSNDSDYSTGYLQDALFEFSSKRRRLLLYSPDQTTYSTSPTHHQVRIFIYYVYVLQNQLIL